MLFDGFHDIGEERYQQVITEGGPNFPQEPITGQLYAHDNHGLCVFCHDSVWRIMEMQPE